jgi:hypothetical protein
MNRPGSFRKTVIRELGEATDHRCARCTLKTSYYDSALKKRIGFGRASHIRAASYNGPRADTEYTPEQLRAAENGVHMCANCADLIDKDSRRFPIEDLEEMQATAKKMPAMACYILTNMEQGLAQIKPAD